MGIRAKRFVEKAAIYALSAVVAFVAIFPIYWMASTSLKTYKGATQIPPLWVPLNPHPENYSPSGKMESLYHGWRAVKDSTICAVGAMALAMVLGVPAAYGFSRFRTRASGSIFSWMFSVRMFPPIAIIIPLFLVLRGLYLIDTYPGIWLVHLCFNLPFAVVMMKGFFDEVTQDLEEVAMTEGCTRFGAFWRIVLPLVKPGIASTAIFCVVFSWNDFIFQWLLTRSNVRAFTVTIPNTVMGAGGCEWNVLAALGTLGFIPVLALAIILQRYLIRGLTLGAVKPG